MPPPRPHPRVDDLARSALARVRQLVASVPAADPAAGGPGAAEPARALRARRAVERLLTLALLASLLRALATRRPEDAAAAPWESLPVDLATDGASRLRLLPGLGVVRTRALLDDRARLGPVGALDDLRRIRGFGPKTVGALRAAGAIVAPPVAPGADARSPPTSAPVGLAPARGPVEDAR